VWGHDNSPYKVSLSPAPVFSGSYGGERVIRTCTTVANTVVGTYTSWLTVSLYLRYIQDRFGTGKQFLARVYLRFSSDIGVL
jgi:hypothetical protein